MSRQALEPFCDNSVFCGTSVAVTSTYQHLQIGLAGLLTVKQVLEPHSIEHSDVIVEGPAGAIHRHSQDAPDALLLDLTPLFDQQLSCLLLYVLPTV